MTTNVLNIRVRTLDQRSHDLSVASDIEIRSLKETIHGLTEVPGDRQRLIYRGRVMADGARLCEYSVEDGHTIHMIARPASTETRSPAAAAAAASASEEAPAGARRLLAGALDLDAARLVSDALGLGRIATPAGARGPRAAGRSGAVPPRAQGGPESLEHVRQGLLTVHTLLSTMEEPERLTANARGRARSEEKEEEEAVVRTPTFYVGQWVDVEDTVHQWLEATVMRVRARRMLVHYNGWPTRWDEWLDFDSRRVAPFRTRTLHSHHSPHASPSPLTSVDDAPATAWARATTARTESSRARRATTAPPPARPRRRAARRDLSLSAGERSRDPDGRAAAASRDARAAAAAAAAARAAQRAAQAPGPATSTSSTGQQHPRRRSRSHVARRCRGEDARVAVNETRRALDRVAPLVDCLADLARDELLASVRPRVPPDETVPGDAAAAAPDDDDAAALPWDWPPPPAVVQRREPDDDCARAARRARREQLRRVARDAAPLFDRVGRVLSDLAPHVAELAHVPWSESENDDDDDDDDDDAPAVPARSPAPAEQPPAVSSEESPAPPGEEEEEDEEVPPLVTDAADSAPDESVSSAAPAPAPTYRRRRRHHRADEEDSYRQLVATPARAPHLYAPSTPGNIDIHIHAILTPLRGGARDGATGAPAPAADALPADPPAAPPAPPADDPAQPQPDADVGPIVAVRARASVPLAAVAVAPARQPASDAPAPAAPQAARGATPQESSSYTAAITNFFNGFFSSSGGSQ
ncbi:hypothetical protein CTAYLR_006829 [Chrysophaeum taylorii]|uniref:Ubiquitin-like domain-containing protein n=1 Tax=Chrysophaeum taylorii TaxID=2483200 RepID=A0AAD7UDW9_9STRA|nr:hypothetical protein CTAYLR_006829 [Chrysophaeum taylorii]